MKGKCYAALMAGLLLALALASCTAAPPGAGPESGGSDAPYAALAAASAIDARTSAWINGVLAAEEQTATRPIVTLSYAAGQGDSGAEDGAAKVVYTGETGSTMYLQIFARISPQSLPTSAPQMIATKVRPVGGCVRKAVMFVWTRGGTPGAWHESATEVTLAPNGWTTVSLVVDASTLTQGIWRIGLELRGDTAVADSRFDTAGTVYVDDFNALDYRKNDFSSRDQLVGTCVLDSDTHTGFASGWEATSAGDGCLTDTISFPNPVPASPGWGAWGGNDFSTQLYGTDELVDLSRSTIVFRIYLPQAALDAVGSTGSGTWLGVYDGSGSYNAISYGLLGPLAAGWNTVSVNCASPRLKDAGDPLCSNHLYDFTKVRGVDLGVWTENNANRGASFTIKLDYIDIVPN